MKQAAKAHTQTRFLKSTKRSSEDELSLGEPFGFFGSKNTLQVASVEHEKRSVKNTQRFMLKLCANIGLRWEKYMFFTEKIDEHAVSER